MSDTGDQKRLDASSAFYLACKEAWRDGQIEPGENKVLHALRTELGITGEKAMEIARHARPVREADRAPAGGRFSRRRYLGSLLHFAYRKGPASEEEEALIERITQRLGLDPIQEEEVRQRVVEAIKKGGGAVPISASNDPNLQAAADEAKAREAKPHLPEPEPEPAKATAQAADPAKATARAADPAKATARAAPPSPAKATVVQPSSANPSVGGGLGGGRWAPWKIGVVAMTGLLYGFSILLSVLTGNSPGWFAPIVVICMAVSTVRMARGEDPPAYAGKPHQVVPAAVILSVIWVVLFTVGVRAGLSQARQRNQMADSVKRAIAEWKVHLDRGAEGVESADWTGARASLEQALESADSIQDPHERNMALGLTRYRVALSYIAEIHQRSEPKFRSSDEAKRFMDHVDEAFEKSVGHLKRIPTNPTQQRFLKEIAGSYADFLDGTKRPDKAAEYKRLAGR